MGAEFTIEGTAFDTLGYDATHGQVLDLALEDSTGLDAPRVVYSVVATSDGAPALTFSPSSGIPTTPTGTVTVTMPGSGAHSYNIQCQVNEGRDSTGRTNREYTKQRIVAIKSTNLEMRKLVPGETTQYSSTGWTQQQNEAVDAIDAGAGGGGGSPEDVAATADTLLLRGSAGEGRVTRIETPIVRTATNGDVEFQQGTTTFARLRSTDACSQPGDIRFDPTTGQVYVYINGLGDAPIRTEKVRWPKATPDAAAGDVTFQPIFDSPGYPWTITSVTFIPSDDLAANATDYADLRIQIYSDATFIGDAAIALTKPSGANATGDWLTRNRVSFTLSSLLAFPIDASYFAAILINKPNAGAIVPAGLLTMTVVPWQS